MLLQPWPCAPRGALCCGPCGSAQGDTRLRKPALQGCTPHTPPCCCPSLPDCPKQFLFFPAVYTSWIYALAHLQFKVPGVLFSAWFWKHYRVLQALKCSVLCRARDHVHGKQWWWGEARTHAGWAGTGSPIAHPKALLVSSKGEQCSHWCPKAATLQARPALTHGAQTTEPCRGTAQNHHRPLHPLTRGTWRITWKCLAC